MLKKDIKKFPKKSKSPFKIAISIVKNDTSISIDKFDILRLGKIYICRAKKIKAKSSFFEKLQI